MSHNTRSESAHSSTDPRLPMGPCRAASGARDPGRTQAGRAPDALRGLRGITRRRRQGCTKRDRDAVPQPLLEPSPSALRRRYDSSSVAVNAQIGPCHQRRCRSEPVRERARQGARRRLPGLLGDARRRRPAAPHHRPEQLVAAGHLRRTRSRLMTYSSGRSPDVDRWMTTRATAVVRVGAWQWESIVSPAARKTGARPTRT